MKSADRMFRVLVLGGVALTACGGAVTTPSSGDDSGTTQDGFPTEGPAQVDAFPSETAQQVDAFPSEGPAYVDTGVDAVVDASADADAFPMEGPPPLDSGSTDAVADAPCFPQETAFSDGGCTPQGD